MNQTNKTFCLSLIRIKYNYNKIKGYINEKAQIENPEEKMGSLPIGADRLK